MNESSLLGPIRPVIAQIEYVAEILIQCSQHSSHVQVQDVQSKRVDPWIDLIDGAIGSHGVDRRHMTLLYQMMRSSSNRF
jgi:hypothetical protein